MDPNKFIAAEQKLTNGKKALHIMKYKHLPKNAQRAGRTKAGQPLFRLPGVAKC